MIRKISIAVTALAVLMVPAVASAQSFVPRAGERVSEGTTVTEVGSRGGRGYNRGYRGGGRHYGNRGYRRGNYGYRGGRSYRGDRRYYRPYRNYSYRPYYRPYRPRGYSYPRYYRYPRRHYGYGYGYDYSAGDALGHALGGLAYYAIHDALTK